MSPVIGTRLKIAALVCLAIPMLILLVFAVGEVAGGTISGLQHVLQVLPLAALAWLGWTRPRWGGMALIGLSLLLAGLYLAFARFPPLALLFNTLLLFAPSLLAGVLFLAAARRAASPSERAADFSRRT